MVRTKHTFVGRIPNPLGCDVHSDAEGIGSTNFRSERSVLSSSPITPSSQLSTFLLTNTVPGALSMKKDLPFPYVLPPNFDFERYTAATLYGKNIGRNSRLLHSRRRVGGLWSGGGSGGGRRVVVWDVLDEGFVDIAFRPHEVYFGAIELPDVIAKGHRPRPTLKRADKDRVIENVRNRQTTTYLVARVDTCFPNLVGRSRECPGRGCRTLYAGEGQAAIVNEPALASPLMAWLTYTIVSSFHDNEGVHAYTPAVGRPPIPTRRLNAQILPFTMFDVDDPASASVFDTSYLLRVLDLVPKSCGKAKGPTPRNLARTELYPTMIWASNSNAQSCPDDDVFPNSEVDVVGVKKGMLVPISTSAGLTFGQPSAPLCIPGGFCYGAEDYRCAEVSRWGDCHGAVEGKQMVGATTKENTPRTKAKVNFGRIKCDASWGNRAGSSFPLISLPKQSFGLVDNLDADSFSYRHSTQCLPVHIKVYKSTREEPEVPVTATYDSSSLSPPTQGFQASLPQDLIGHRLAAWVVRCSSARTENDQLLIKQFNGTIDDASGPRSIIMVVVLYSSKPGVLRISD
ncbi:hypothetical protein F5146DRAFT_1120751 [Armillaria mellea]|nr:hypothetical protein F5146DRAFT_1120751 [Armillaria mellea]